MDSYLNNSLEFNTHSVLGIKENAVGLAENDIYTSTVSEDIRTKVSEIANQLKDWKVEVSTALGMKEADLKEMGIEEKVFAEPEHFTAETMSNIADELEKNIEGYLEEYTNKDIQELVDSRYERFRRM